MTKIIELAHMLGTEIAASEEIKKLEEAKNRYEQDEEIQKYMGEYEAERRLLGEEFSKESSEIDQKAVADLRARIEELTKIITANPVYQEFSQAQGDVNKLMADVNAEIKFCITGERPSECTHDCSKCSGCH